jgi:tRNA (guanine-N7-)-methyltransferase
LITSFKSDFTILTIKTFYEQQWILQGITIKNISFVPHHNPLVEPDAVIEPDPYRSFGRSAVSVD